MEKLKDVSWVKFNSYSNSLICERCDTVYKMPDEATEIEAYTKLLSDFGKEHRNCEESKIKCGCKSDVIGVEYYGMSPHHYDGVSEWRCSSCHRRWGRFCGKELKNREAEPRYCEGKEPHPKYE